MRHGLLVLVRWFVPDNRNKFCITMTHCFIIRRRAK